MTENKEEKAIEFSKTERGKELLEYDKSKTTWLIDRAFQEGVHIGQESRQNKLLINKATVNAIQKARQEVLEEVMNIIKRAKL